MIEPSREVDAEQLRRIRDWAGVDKIRPAEPKLAVFEEQDNNGSQEWVGGIHLDSRP